VCGIVRYFFTQRLLYQGIWEQNLANVSWCLTEPVPDVPGLHIMQEEAYYTTHWVFLRQIEGKVVRLMRDKVFYFLEPHALPM